MNGSTITELTRLLYDLERSIANGDKNAAYFAIGRFREFLGIYVTQVSQEKNLRDYENAQKNIHTNIPPRTIGD